MFAHLALPARELGHSKLSAMDALDGPNASYIVYVDDRYGLMASLRLLPATDGDTPIHALLSLDDHVLHQAWECSRVFCYIAEKFPIHEARDGSFDHVLRRAYAGLFDGLKAFAKEQSAQSIVTLHPLEEHEDIEFFGSWPFVLKSKVRLTLPPTRLEDDYMVGVIDMAEQLLPKQ